MLSFLPAKLTKSPFASPPFLPSVRLSFLPACLPSVPPSQRVFKQGGGGGFPPHQDMTFIYSRVCTDAVNFGIAFDTADEENGSLQVAPGLEAQVRGTYVRE